MPWERPHQEAPRNKMLPNGINSNWPKLSEVRELGPQKSPRNPKVWFKPQSLKIPCCSPLSNQPDGANARETAAADQLANKDLPPSQKPISQKYIAGKVGNSLPVDIFK